MTKLKVGDKVKINPAVTNTPWKGELTGTLVYIDADGTAAVEVDSHGMHGHVCSLSPIPTKNGWWFTLEELTLIK